MTAFPRRPDVNELEVFGDLETDKLYLAEPDPEWALGFATHERRIRHAIGSTAIAVHHVGSTSVAGLAAKPIIDILLVVPDITAEEDYLAPLVDAGYALRVREPGHRMLRTPARDVHLHMHQPDAPDTTDLLLFRDRLRSHPQERELYESTKRELLEREWTHMQAYADAKDQVIAEIKERARARSRPRT
ncbi:GrpB family protein [Nocardioides malaquae]|uniref:GrpB family protein n=1 Tax=Nocardioides malaquae TaxID=2773426 RepID=UPI0029D412D9|nr:GrpB family protein [Nocardioides malaquae]